MAKGLHAGDLTLEQLEKKFDKFQRDMPGITKEGLKKGTKVLLNEMKRRYISSGLHQRSGDLFRSIKVLGVERKGKKVNAAVGVGMTFASGRNYSQVYKAVAHELGMTVGHGVTLPRRAFVGPTKRAKLNQVREMLLDELIAGYRKSG